MTRVSVVPDDPGFTAYTGNVRVWFDGELQELHGRSCGRMILTADDQVGMIRFNLVRDGLLVLDEGGHVREFTAFGRVYVELVGRA